jgi:homoserine kinase
VERKTAVRHGAQFAQFVHALHCGDAQLAGQCVVDHIAEPYRRELLPGFDEARVALREIGALAVGISGSGPTIFALVDDYDVAEKTARWLDKNYRQNDTGFVHVCRADQGGARCID